MHPYFSLSISLCAQTSSMDVKTAINKTTTSKLGCGFTSAYVARYQWMNEMPALSSQISLFLIKQLVWFLGVMTHFVYNAKQVVWHSVETIFRIANCLRHMMFRVKERIFIRPIEVFWWPKNIFIEIIKMHEYRTKAGKIHTAADLEVSQMN